MLDISYPNRVNGSIGLGPMTGELLGLFDRKYSDLSEYNFHYIFPYFNRIGFDLCRCRKFYHNEGTVSLLGWLRDVENNQAAVRKLEEQQRIWEYGRKKERRRRTKRKIQKNTLNNYFFSLQTL